MAAKPETEIDLDELMRTKREALTAKREEIQAELDKIGDQLRRIEAYLNPDALVPQAEAPPDKLSKTSRTPRETRGGIRAEVLALIQDNPKGLTAKQINTHFGAEDDKGKKQSIANALGILKDSNLITQAVRRAPYLPTTPKIPQQVLDDVTISPPAKSSLDEIIEDVPDKETAA